MYFSIALAIYTVAARRRHIQFFYKSKSFYSAYVYRIEKYRITAKIFNTYRIVRHAYRYTPIIYQPIATAILDTVECLTFILIDVVTMLTVSTLNRLGILLIYAVQK